jgi:WD40 repeat protein
VGQRQGRAVIVSGSGDQTVRVWDLEKLKPVGAPLEGHSGEVKSVAVGQRQGRAVIVSGSYDQTVRVWDLETLEPVGARLEGHSLSVTSVAVGQRQGRAVIVSAEDHRSARERERKDLQRRTRIALGTPCRRVVLTGEGFVAATDWGILRIALL